MCDQAQAQYKPKPSKGLFFHLWGGLCLNSLADASGISRLMIQALIPHTEDMESAVMMARWAGALTALIIITGSFFSSRLVLAIENAGLAAKQKERILFSLPFIYFIVIFPLSMAASAFIDL